MEPARSCPICPKCGSKRFIRLPGEKVTVKCRSCDNVIEIKFFLNLSVFSWLIFASPFGYVWQKHGKITISA